MEGLNFDKLACSYFMAKQSNWDWLILQFCYPKWLQWETVLVAKPSGLPETYVESCFHQSLFPSRDFYPGPRNPIFFLSQTWVSEKQIQELESLLEYSGPFGEKPALLRRDWISFAVNKRPVLAISSHFRSQNILQGTVELLHQEHYSGKNMSFGVLEMRYESWVHNL